METKIITRQEDLAQALEVLRRDALVAVPTETVYGLAVKASSKAVHAVYELKGRPENKPLSLLTAGPEGLDLYGKAVPPAAYTLANKFWPGPLTIVVRADIRVPDVIRAGLDTVGLRCPNHPLTLALIRAFGLPLGCPSANPSGLPSPRTAEDVLAYFDGKLPAVIDGGPCAVGLDSTIIDMSAAPYRILRSGSLSEEAIDGALVEAMEIIGLTGGTGSGKTTVLSYLTGQGALGLDCDTIYHELLKGCVPMLSEMEERFPQVFTSHGLDRKRLGTLVFADSDALRDLNAITHRHVKEEVARRLRDFARNGGRMAVIDAIGLFESGLADLCTRTVCVTAETDVRMRRIMVREGIGAEYARARIAAQKPDDWFAARCSHILYNNGTEENLLCQCRELFG